MSRQRSESDVIIVGAGAAGLMCAITAAARGRKVLLLEGSSEIGAKIRISGGGRCNFTNTGSSPQNFISSNPHFVRSALARYTPADFIELVRKHGISYHEKKLGQLFCDGSSREIIDALLQECLDAGVRIECDVKIEKVEKVEKGEQSEEGFKLTSADHLYRCQRLVIATGGLSIPAMGATDFAGDVARQFDIAIVKPKPGLVPFTLTPSDLTHLRALAGVSLDAVVRCNDIEFHENILFTHRGLSGPAILQISSYWNPGDAISINILPSVDVHELLRNEHRSRTELKNVLAQFLSKRFCDAWCEAVAPSRPMNTYTHAEVESIADNIQAWTLKPAGTEGFAKAEVTVGGVDTHELSSKTMECRRVPGLHFIGECVDVTGWLGGYNFQWAWASGHAAGEFV